MIAVTESLAAGMHHHHAVRCEDCGAWWFDDTVAGPLGIPVPTRRDTVLCACPEDGTERYTEALIYVPEPEDACHCTAALVERHVIDIRAGGRP
jgi:hypothetical protein